MPKPVNKTREGKVILITGASSGLGKTCAEVLLKRGHSVYGTSRKAKFLDNSPEPDALKMIPMDVNDDISVARAIAHVIDQAGTIHVIVNNAGYGIAGSIEDTTLDEAKALFETNFFGIHRVCRAAIPHLREQGFGHIINVGSLGGVVSIPFQSFYSASKAALASLSNGLSMELKPFGISVTRIEPGDYRTGFTANRVFVDATDPEGVYGERCSRAIAVMEHDEQNGAEPKDMANILVKIIESRHPALNYRVGLFMQKLLIGLVPFLPDRLVEKLLMSTYRISS
jgi:short-subunit dehydrogenase